MAALTTGSHESLARHLVGMGRVVPRRWSYHLSSAGRCQRDEKAADTILLQRFERAMRPSLHLQQRIALQGASAHRKYPMYRGLSRLLGMLALDPNVGSLHARRAMAAHNWHPVPAQIHAASALADDISPFRRIRLSWRRSRPASGSTPHGSGAGTCRAAQEVRRLTTQ